VRVAGWPRDLPSAPSREFDTGVVAWLLDRGPGELRASPLRRHPVGLAAYVLHHLEGCLAGARTAYAQARVELGSVLEPAALREVMSALEAEGARLLNDRREVGLVLAALTSGGRPGGRVDTEDPA